MLDLGALLLWLFGQPFPAGEHQFPLLDADLVQALTTLGGFAIGAALVASIQHARYRHSAAVLLVGYAIFGVMAAVAEHRITLATDFPTITVLRKDRDQAIAVTAIALAGVLWLYWRRLAAADRRAMEPRA
jgi:hypothetical protein